MNDYEEVTNVELAMTIASVGATADSLSDSELRGRLVKVMDLLLSEMTPAYKVSDGNVTYLR